MFRNGAAVTLSILVLSVTVLFASDHIGLAQSQNQSVPNLSGTWELIEFDGTKKKTLGDKFPQLTLLITQEGSQIRITQKRILRGVEKVYEYSYYTDGRGETNNGRVEVSSQDLPGFESVSGWKKDKLLTEYNGKVQILTGSYTHTALRQKAEWRLASDGKSLVLTNSAVQMHFSSIGGHGTQAGDLRVGGSDQDRTASWATFGKSKLVFRRV